MNIKEIELKKLVQSDNSRLSEYETDSKMAELMDNIKQVGLLQPIGVTPTGKDGNYEILFGNRRYVAFKKLGRYSIPSMVFETKDDDEFLVVNLIENLQRKDLSTREQCSAFKELESRGLTASEIAVRVGMSVNKVSRILRAYSIPANFRSKVYHGAGNQAKKGKISSSVADTIIGLKKELGLTSVETERLFKRAGKEEMSAEELRTIAYFVREGKTLDSAFKEVAKVKVVHCQLVVDRKEVAELQSKYGCTIGNLTRRMLFGEVKERFTRIIGEDRNEKA